MLSSFIGVIRELQIGLENSCRLDWILPKETAILKSTDWNLLSSCQICQCCFLWLQADFVANSKLCSHLHELHKLGRKYQSSYSPLLVLSGWHCFILVVTQGARISSRGYSVAGVWGARPPTLPPRKVLHSWSGRLQKSRRQVILKRCSGVISVLFTRLPRYTGFTLYGFLLVDSEFPPW